MINPDISQMVSLITGFINVLPLLIEEKIHDGIYEIIIGIYLAVAYIIIGALTAITAYIKSF